MDNAFPLKIILPLLTPSLNVYLNMYYIQRWKLIHQYEWELTALGANDLKFKVNWMEKRKATIITHRKRLLDMDNFIGGTKPLIDALENLELIFLDNTVYLKSEYIQYKSKVERTEIIIERI